MLYTKLVSQIKYPIRLSLYQITLRTLLGSVSNTHATIRVTSSGRVGRGEGLLLTSCGHSPHNPQQDLDTDYSQKRFIDRAILLFKENNCYKNPIAYTHDRHIYDKKIDNRLTTIGDRFKTLAEARADRIHFDVGLRRFQPSSSPSLSTSVICVFFGATQQAPSLLSMNRSAIQC